MTVRITSKKAIARQVLGVEVQKAAASLPQTATASIFTITGRILLKSLIGEVTTIIQNQACNLKVLVNPSVGADVDICAAINIANDAVGTLYGPTGTFAHNLQKQASGGIPVMGQQLVLADGAIQINTSASNTGAIKWTLHYVPLDGGATVVAA